MNKTDAISESVKQRDLKQTMQVLIPLELLNLTYTIKVSKTVLEFARIQTETLLYPGILLKMGRKKMVGSSVIQNDGTKGIIQVSRFISWSSTAGKRT